MVASTPAIRIRVASAHDLAGISTVRTSVHENHLSREQLDARGITNDAVAASFEKSSRGWVALVDDRIVGFSIADREQRSIFALFVLPEHEGRGIGTTLLDHATEWLHGSGVEPIWLTTGAETNAAGFYRRRGWLETRRLSDGQNRFEWLGPSSDNSE